MRTARFASSSPLARSRNAGPGLGCAMSRSWHSVTARAKPGKKSASFSAAENSAVPERRVASLPAGAREPIERLVNDLPLDGHRVRTHREALEVAPARTQELPATRAPIDFVEARAAPRGRRVGPCRGPLQLVE